MRGPGLTPRKGSPSNSSVVLLPLLAGSQRYSLLCESQHVVVGSMICLSEIQSPLLYHQALDLVILVDPLTLPIVVVLLLLQLVLGWFQAGGGEGHHNVKGGERGRG